MKREMFDTMEIDESALAAMDDESDAEDTKKPGRPRKRYRDPLFLLDKKQRKFLKTASPPSPFPPSSRLESHAPPASQGQIIRRKDQIRLVIARPPSHDTFECR